MLGNLVIGLLGAVVGGILFDLLGIHLDNIAITLGDLLGAFVGALVVLLALGLLRGR